MNDYLTIYITKENSNITIKDYLSNLGVGKKIIHEYSQLRFFFVNGIPTHSMYQLKLHDILEILLIDKNDDEVSPNSIEILYENSDYLAVKKPRGLLTHSDGLNKDHLTSRVAYYMQKKNYQHKVLPVHRLDVDTEGIVLFAKNFISLSYLSKLFEERKIIKKYYAMVEGKINQSGVIDKPLSMNKKLNKMIVDPKGQPSKTSYKLIKYSNENSILDITLHSGRTHQIRAHFSSIYHPIVGDSIYGNGGEKLELYAYYLEFIDYKTKEKVIIKDNIPY